MLWRPCCAAHLLVEHACRRCCRESGRSCNSHRTDGMHVWRSVCLARCAQRAGAAQEKKRQELAAKKAEAKKLLEAEEASLASAGKKKTPAKVAGQKARAPPAPSCRRLCSSPLYAEALIAVCSGVKRARLAQPGDRCRHWLRAGQQPAAWGNQLLGRPPRCGRAFFRGSTHADAPPARRARSPRTSC